MKILFFCSLFFAIALWAKDDDQIKRLQARMRLNNLVSHDVSGGFFEITKFQKALKFDQFIKEKTLMPLKDQEINHFLNQVYLSTRYNFNFSKTFYFQSGKIFRKFKVERMNKRDQGERVRLFFFGFSYDS